MTLDLLIKKNIKKRDTKLYIVPIESESIKLNDKNFYSYKNFYHKNKKIKNLNNHLYNKFNYINRFLKFTNNYYRPISIYHIKFFDKFLGHLVKKGKKATAENIFYNLIFFLRKRTQLNPFKLLYKAVINTRPIVEIKSIRKSGRSLEVPQMVKFSRQFFLAIKWLIKSSEESKENISNSLGLEILDAAKYKGKAFLTKKTLMKRAVAGRINQTYKPFYKKNIIKKKKIKFKRFFIDVKRSVSYIEGSHKKDFIL